MTIIVRGYGGGKLRFVDHVDVSEEELAEDKLWEFAKRHVDRVMGYEMHMLELEFVGAPEAERFFRFGTDTGRMVMPIEVPLPDNCADCGAVLMGGATRHSKDCSFRKLIEEAFPDYEMPKDGP